MTTRNKASTMSDLTLPVMLHPKYSTAWRPGQARKPAGPQQYPYSDSETMSTEEDTSEFLQYRKYRYGLSHQSSMNLLEEMGRADVNDEPWPKNHWVIGGQDRQESRQQQQLQEVRGLRPFSAGYPKESLSKVKDGQNTATAPAAQAPSRPTTHREAPKVGRMLGRGGITPLRIPQTQPQRQSRTNTPAVRTTRAQQLRAQAVQAGAASTSPRGRAPSTSRGQTSGRSSRGMQHVTQPGSSLRSQGGGVSAGGSPSTPAGNSSLPGQNVGAPGPQPSSNTLVSTTSTVQPNDDLATNVQVGVEIEFVIALEKKTNVEPRRERPKDYRYFIPLEERTDTTIIDVLPARKYISRLLRDAGIPAVSDHEFRDEVRQAAACFNGWLDQHDEYAHWSVKYEPVGTAMDFSEDEFQFAGIELASRKLGANAHGFREIRDVLRILRRRVLVATSTSCGVHIHVDASALDLQERKNFACLYLLAERELFSLTAPHRRGGNTWCAPVSEKSKLAEDADDILEEMGVHDGQSGHPPSARRMATMTALIQECASTEELQQAIGRNKLPPYHRSALNLKEVGDHSYTFEFRHFQTSLDPEVIEHFVRLCVALMLSAKGLGQPGRPSFDETYGAFDNMNGWKRFLTTIGLQGTIDFWENLLQTYPDTPEGSPSDSSRSEGDGRPSSFLAPLD